MIYINEGIKHNNNDDKCINKL